MTWRFAQCPRFDAHQSAVSLKGEAGAVQYQVSGGFDIMYTFQYVLSKHKYYIVWIYYQDLSKFNLITSKNILAGIIEMQSFARFQLDTYVHTYVCMWWSDVAFPLALNL